MSTIRVSSVTRISTAADGTQANGNSYGHSFSPDGTKVAFSSRASNLIAGDTNAAYDVFIKDLPSGAVTRISTASNGTQMFDSGGAVFSRDGNGVAFLSESSVGWDFAYLKDLRTGGLWQVTGDVYGNVTGMDFSPDGNSLLVMVTGNPAGTAAFILVNLATGQVANIDIADGANGFGFNAHFSPDGHEIAYSRFPSGVYVMDLTTAKGTLIDPKGSNPIFSPVGRNIAFESTSADLVPGDTNGVRDVFVKDLTTGAITRISTADDGTQANGDSFEPIFSPDGNLVAFASAASNLVPGDTNGKTDILVKDLTTGSITRISTTAVGEEANGGSAGAHFSPDGSKILYTSDASNLVPGDTNQYDDVFIAALQPQTNGTTTLALSANHFHLLHNGSGPSLKFSGQDVVVGQFGDWTPIAAEQTQSGYEVAWKSLGSNLYSLWNTDANGNYIANIGGVVSGSDSTLRSAESFFQQDLNGDGQIASAMAPIETNGPTTLASSANHFYLLQSGIGPSLKFSGQDVVVGQFGDWTPIAAEATASGYEIAWKSSGSNTYSLWNTDANGNYLANIVGAVLGSDPTLVSAEGLFQQDLNGDGQVGMVPIETNGATTLASSASHFYLLQNGNGPSLKFSGQDVVGGQFGDWTPIAAEKTASGYEIAWKSLGSNLYSLWNTDANGNYLANVGGAVSGSDPTLVSAESFFQQDLNGDGHWP